MGIGVLFAHLLNKRIPLNVMLSVTNHCPSRCSYCNIPDRNQKELTTKQIFYLIDELSENIVVKTEHFIDPCLNSNNFYINPFNDEVKQIVAKNRKNGFALMKIPQEQKLFIGGKFFVIQISDIADVLAE